MNKLFNENGFAIKDCRVQVYNYDRENNEYISSTQEHVVKGSGIPAQSTLIEVIKEKECFARVFNEDEQKWEYVEDHRDEDVFSTIDGQKVEIKEIGALAENLTLKPRTSIYHNFINGDWVEDIEARKQAEKEQKEEANKAFLTSETRRVNDAIAPLDDAIEFEIATDEEVAQHKELRKYRILLSRVPNQEAWPLEVTWPECPEFFKTKSNMQAK